ncbi:MAG: Smr/MutS family protein [Myxococcota bacterium]|nr:Smr/MutS family protein [Myxococcota bacterium]
MSDLDWGRLLEHLATRASSEGGAQLCRKLPLLPPVESQKNLVLVAEISSAIEAGDPPPSLPAEPFTEWLACVRGEAMVPAEGLQSLSVNLKLYVSLARYFDNRRDACPANATLVLPSDRGISPLALSRLASEIDTTFEPDGSISDNASPELGRLRRRVTALRTELLGAIDAIAEKESDILQDKCVTLRNDRYVLPVRADAHRRLRGIVHGSSGSGATVFVEPDNVVGLGNEIMLAKEEVAREERRILASLSAAVRDQLETVTFACETILLADVRIASGRLCNDLRCCVVQPSRRGEIHLVGARHPLLVLDAVAVVANDICAEPGRAVVVSGPNAGGKTVVLKTLGLCGLMLAAGLPIPAAPESAMSPPPLLLTDIGDDQSLEKSLSTFSAHMSNIAAIIATAEERAIVLLDELAAGTDPTEGAALARALLEHLCSAGAITLATTHFDALKSSACADERFVNAAVGFDPDSMRPTFHLRRGTPGASSALSVAQRYGVPEPVVRRAEALLPEAMRELARAVSALEDERQSYETMRANLEAQADALEKEKRSLAGELAKLRQRQDKLVDDEARALWEDIQRTREQVRAAAARVRSSKNDAQSIASARKTVEDAASKLLPGGALEDRSQHKLPGRPAVASELKVGARVYIISLGKAGQVSTEPKDNRLFVEIGSLRTMAKLDDLRLLPAAERASKSSSQRAERSAAISAPSETGIRTSDNTLDLRGLRVDEALDAVDVFLDRATQYDSSLVYVLHGHGTGALRQAVREHLKRHPLVEESRPGEPPEGGDGVTCARLR